MITKNNKFINLTGDFEIIIGRDARPCVSPCRICFTAIEVPEIANKHALLKRVRDRLFIQDLGSDAGTLLDDVPLLPKIWEEIIQTGNNKISLGQTPIGINPALFRGRERVGIETTALYYELAGRMLCNGVYLRAKPGTMTAIMGPAGCGKSTLLDLVSGYRRPNHGQVFVTSNNEKINIHEDYSQIRAWLGFLPQDDMMIPELTVYQSLSYCLKLQFIGLDAKIRDHIICNTCSQLGFEKPRLHKFLNTVIGSAESGIRGLSGGERKRANLAHELISMPLILLLDEPTSGLSSVDAEKIISLLKKLTRQDELSTIITIHQPSRDTFESFDNLLLMNHDGTVAYYGACQDATNYFEKITGTSVVGCNPAEYLLAILDNPVYNKKITDSFQADQIKNSPKFP